MNCESLMPGTSEILAICAQPLEIESRIRICVLALLIQRVAELKCGQSWFKIRSELGKRQAVACEGVKEVIKSLKTPLPKGIFSISNVGRQP